MDSFNDPNTTIDLSSYRVVLSVPDPETEGKMLSKKGPFFKDSRMTLEKYNKKTNEFKLINNSRNNSRETSRII
jgi:hypothetical protein